jgi:hypothetical protein
MITNAKIALSALIVLAAASTAFAKSSGGLPKLDIEYACQASQKAVAAIFSVTMDVFSACISDETAAREQLEKDWASFPAANKARCIQPKEYLPSYVEWVTCLEMTRDVKAMRKGQPEIATTVDKCPVVRFHEDGTIVSVTAC